MACKHLTSTVFYFERHCNTRLGMGSALESWSSLRFFPPWSGLFFFCLFLNESQNCNKHSMVGRHPKAHDLAVGRIDWPVTQSYFHPPNPSTA